MMGFSHTVLKDPPTSALCPPPLFPLNSEFSARGPEVSGAGQSSGKGCPLTRSRLSQGSVPGLSPSLDQGLTLGLVRPTAVKTGFPQQPAVTTQASSQPGPLRFHRTVDFKRKWRSPRAKTGRTTSPVHLSWGDSGERFISVVL